MNQSLVSIIIPAYNSRNYIEETIESALKQTHDAIEIILVDDGSTDGTQDLFPDFEKKGIQCYRINNNGASSARNFGLSKARGDYVQFLDADDILNEFKIEKQLRSMESREADICYSPWIDFKIRINDYQETFKFSNVNYNVEQSGKDLMISFGIDNWFIPTLSWLVNRKLIDKAGLWDVDIINNNDGEYFSRVLFYAERVICCDEYLAYYRRTPNSLGKLNSSSKIDASFYSYQKIETLLSPCNDQRLMSYPKRMYYMQYKRIRNKYPHLAKRAAKNFNRIQAPSFLSKKVYYWKFIKLFGLYYGTKLYKSIQPIWSLLQKDRTS